MVKKVQGRGPGPLERKFRWTDWLLVFLADEPEATVEEYLASCRKDFTITKQHERMAKRLTENPYFQAWLDDHRRELGVDPEEVKQMSAEDLVRLDRLIWRTAPEFKQHLLLQCKHLSLSPAWRDFIESMVLFNEGSAGYHDLVDIVGCWLDPESHMLTIKVRVEGFLKKEIADRLWSNVKWAKGELFGRTDFRLHDVAFEELDKRCLFLILVKFEGYTETEGSDMLDRYNETGIIDDSIRRVYPDVAEEKLREFLDGLVKEGMEYDDIHTIVKNNVARLELTAVDKSLFGDWYRFWHLYLDEGQFNWPLR